jgi:hypothetical protein
MAVAFAPFDDSPGESSRPPRVVVNKGPLPVSDNTECNFIIMFFVAGVFLLGLVDATRGSK